MAGKAVKTNIANRTIAEVLDYYKTRDKFLGYKAAAAFEAGVVRVVEGGGITFAEFKKIIAFMESNIFDDSATGLEYLYAALNKVLRNALDAEGKDKHWKWVKEHLLSENNFFLETVISLYKEAHQAELLEILKKAVAADADDDEEMEFYKHSGEYYIALCLKDSQEDESSKSSDSAYEAYLDNCIKNSNASPYETTDIKLLKADLLVSRGEKKAAFELLKDECVLEAAELLEGDEKEEYLFDQVMHGRETVVGQRRSWWDKLCESFRGTASTNGSASSDDEHSGDESGAPDDRLTRYMNTLLSSPKHCEMVNWQLYELGRFEELKARIDTGWIYDDLWGRLNNDCISKFEAIKGYKKLKTLYPEWCTQIMIDYAVFMMDTRKSRQAYKMSAQTIARAGKLSDKSMEMVENVAKELVEKNPKRKAMIEELEKAGLV